MPPLTSGHILFIYVLSLLFSLVSAQDLSVPTSWRVIFACYPIPKARHDVELCTLLETEHFSTTFRADLHLPRRYQLHSATIGLCNW